MPRITLCMMSSSRSWAVSCLWHNNCSRYLKYDLLGEAGLTWRLKVVFLHSLRSATRQSALPCRYYPRVERGTGPISHVLSALLSFDAGACSAVKSSRNGLGIARPSRNGSKVLWFLQIPADNSLKSIEPYPLTSHSSPQRSLTSFFLLGDEIAFGAGLPINAANALQARTESARLSLLTSRTGGVLKSVHEFDGMELSSSSSMEESSRDGTLERDGRLQVSSSQESCKGSCSTYHFRIVGG
mmetsp:Transcript_9833/g.24050  ORF Transcript_9833/g.24050 Transcript_9833/m.24050 type:complete len:242 (+) Transcript_9833:220-945(+)